MNGHCQNSIKPHFHSRVELEIPRLQDVLLRLAPRYAAAPNARCKRDLVCS